MRKKMGQTDRQTDTERGEGGRVMFTISKMRQRKRKKDNDKVVLSQSEMVREGQRQMDRQQDRHPEKEIEIGIQTNALY